MTDERADTRSDTRSAALFDASSDAAGSIPCREHLPLLRGLGRYLDDIHLPGVVHVAFVRSPHAHARILDMATEEARAMPGVLAVITGQELRHQVRPIRALLDEPSYRVTDWHPLAWDKVRYVGEAVAAVVATDRYRAEDGAEQVLVRYEPLPAAPHADQALRPDAPRIHPELPDNLLLHARLGQGKDPDAFRQAPIRVSGRFQHPRVTGLPMEGCGVLAWHEPGADQLTVWSSNQVPHLLRDSLAECLGHPTHRLRVIAPEVGGGFGIKMQTLPEEIVVAHLARALGRPVKWTQDRMEHMQASIHARDIWVEAELALSQDGRILGLEARAVCDVGAYNSYPLTSALEPFTVASALPGPYDFPHYQVEVMAVATNKCPVGAYRGVGFVLGPLVMEGLLDRAARQLGMDPAELRRRNLPPPDAFPFPSPAGPTYDSGDYPALLDLALEQADYPALRRQQEEARAQGRLLGIGLACFVEVTGMGRGTYRKRGMVQIPAFDGAAIQVDRWGQVTVAVSTPSQGQGQRTTFAQLLARELGIPLESIQVRLGDTDLTPYGSGTFASRSLVSGGGALVQAAGKLQEKLIRLAAAHWEIHPEDVRYVDGAVEAVDRSRRLTFQELAALAHEPFQEMPPGVEPGLAVEAAYNPPPAASSAAVHLALVEVDRETGLVQVLGYTVAEDCGPMINPQVVEGQVRGGVAQGIGIALLEEICYDREGQLLTGTLMDYLAPGICEMPDIHIAHMATPSPWTLHGSKGVGESGTIGAPAAITNAVLDALQVDPAEVRLPLTPERVWELIHGR